MGNNSKSKITPYLYLVPCMLIFGIFLFYPFVKTIYLSLYKTNKMGQAKLYVGLDNYKELLQSASFINSLKVTLIFVLIVVIGGIGSISGSCIASFLYVAASEWWLRFLDTETYIGAFKVPFLRTGFRMVVFSIIIMIVVLFFRRGLMGDRELSDVARSLRARLSGRSKKKEAAK